MNISDKARKNHEKLFPQIPVEEGGNDDELNEILLNFNFDEVWRYDHLDEKTRMMCVLACTIASQTNKRFEVFVNAAMNVGVTPVEIREVVYQAVPYIGVLKVLDLLEPMNAIFKERGVALPLPKQTTVTHEERFEKGRALQWEIFGKDVIEGNREKAPEDQEPVQTFLSDNCFGDYYTRNGLDIPTRELMTFVFLLSQSGLEPQLKGHIAGNLAVGNDRQKLVDVVTALCPYIGYPRTLNALRCINEMTK
jgi:4-carboxymuconolactone decarboxylase